MTAGWLLAGWQWAVMPLVVYLSYSVLFVRDDIQTWENRPHFPLLVLGLSGLVFAVVQYFILSLNLYYSYTLSWAVALVGIGMVRVESSGIRRVIIDAVTVSLRGWLVLFFPFVLLQKMEAEVILAACAAIILVYLAVILCGITRLYAGKTGDGRFQWIYIALIAMGISASGLVIQSQIIKYLMID